MHHVQSHFNLWNIRHSKIDGFICHMFSHPAFQPHAVGGPSLREWWRLGDSETLRRPSPPSWTPQSRGRETRGETPVGPSPEGSARWEETGCCKKSEVKSKLSFKILHRANNPAFFPVPTAVPGIFVLGISLHITQVQVGDVTGQFAQPC